MQILGLDPDALDRLRTTGIDHGGNPVEPFVDDTGGWPLRCCLQDSAPGDEVAIVAWCPFPWSGPYAETGPIVIHAKPCAGPGDDDSVIPAQFLSRRQVVRPYTSEQRIAYDLTRIVEDDGTLPTVLAEVLAEPAVDFVLVRNVASGCYSFSALAR